MDTPEGLGAPSAGGMGRTWLEASCGTQQQRQSSQISGGHPAFNGEFDESKVYVHWGIFSHSVVISARSEPPKIFTVRFVQGNSLCLQKKNINFACFNALELLT